MRVLFIFAVGFLEELWKGRMAVAAVEVEAQAARGTRRAMQFVRQSLPTEMPKVLQKVMPTAMRGPLRTWFLTNPANMWMNPASSSRSALRGRAQMVAAGAVSTAGSALVGGLIRNVADELAERDESLAGNAFDAVEKVFVTFAKGAAEEGYTYEWLKSHLVPALLYAAEQTHHQGTPQNHGVSRTATLEKALSQDINKYLHIYLGYPRPSDLNDGGEQGGITETEQVDKEAIQQEKKKFETKADELFRKLLPEIE